MRRAVARAMPWWLRGIVALVVLGRLVSLPGMVRWWLPWMLVALALVRPAKRDGEAPVTVAPPVQGRWTALNSPADRVPSHGVRAYGQSHAIDILHPRPGGHEHGLGLGLGMHRPDDRSTFGSPVLAMAGGVVAATCGWQRDHRTRTSWPSVAYLLVVEGLVREIVGGPRFVLGNHVILDHGDGTYSTYAHLRRGSLQVGPGDRVSVGQQLAEVGNSGNSTEPHLHVQLMDHPVPTAAAGLPFRWRDTSVDSGLPRKHEAFETLSPAIGGPDSAEEGMKQWT